MRRRLILDSAAAKSLADQFARDVETGLTAFPKRLSCRFFYDPAGSRLFERICALPEYYLTRTEHRILQERAAQIVCAAPRDTALVELGSGSAVKTRVLIEAFLERREKLLFVPVDISPTILERSSLELLDLYPNLEIITVAAEYGAGLERLRETLDGSKLILFLGSNIGNFSRPEAVRFLGLVRRTMAPGDRLLVGIDLRKERQILEPAYDDARGITARFNLNILARINRELGGRFDLETFRHRAVYNEEEGRVEMYLVSTCAQKVVIENLEMEVGFAEGETIHSENSCKYSTAEIDELADASGLDIEARWFDGARHFSLNLLKPRQRQACQE